MSANSFFKIPSYDSSSNEDEDKVQQHSSSKEASREYMDPDLIPDRCSDTNEEEEDDDDDDDEPEDDGIDE
jgi:hypothetical protein